MGPFNSERVLAAIDDARRHGLLHLSSSNLVCVPAPVFTLSATLRRLDLSANLLTALPDAIASLTQLHSLWLSDNPRLTALPPALAQCAQLTVLDVRATALRSLPCELAQLARLRVLDMGETPLHDTWILKGHLEAAPPKPFACGAQRDQCERVLHKLTRKHERTTLKKELYEKLRDDIYHIERRDTASNASLTRTIQRLCKRFPLADELRSVIRNAERLFPSLAAGASPPLVLPQTLDALDATDFRRRFDQLKTDHERTKRAADLELKIRALYFDRIDPKRVAPMVEAIYSEMRELRDIKFLLQHAATVFPPNASDVDAKEVLRRVVALQDEISRERQAAVDKLLVVVKGIYSDAEPHAVQQLVAGVAALFKTTTDLRSLAADAASMFPHEFLNAQPSEIRAAFVQHKHHTLGAAAAASNPANASVASSTTKPRGGTKP